MGWFTGQLGERECAAQEAGGRLKACRWQPASPRLVPALAHLLRAASGMSRTTTRRRRARHPELSPLAWPSERGGTGIVHA